MNLALTRWWTVLTRAGAVVVPAGLLLLAAAVPASAHAVLQDSAPRDGDQLDAAPDEVTLDFNEPVGGELGAIRVFDGTGTQVDEGDAGPGASDTQLTVGLPELGEGTYVATWTAVSADGHPIRGAFMFTIGEGGAGADDDLIADLLSGGDAAGWQIAATVNRWITYAAVLLAAGGVLFCAFVHDRRAAERRLLGRVVSGAAAAAVLSSLLGIGLQGAVGSGLGAPALVSGDVLASVATSGFGASALLRIAGAVLVGAAALALWRPAAVVAGTVGALAAMGSFALTGHTVVTEPRWLAAAANVAHTLFGAAWFGGLVLLALVLRRRHAGDDAVGGGALVARFSTYATATVAVVVVAGTTLAWSEVRAVRALFSTAYGWTLVTKIILVAAILLAAAYNRQRLVPAIKAAEDAAGAAWRRLRRTIGIEVGGIAVVLLISALLVNLTPARTAAGVGGFFSEFADLGGEHVVNLTVEPNRAGHNELHLYLQDQRGRLAEVERLTLSFTQPAREIGPLERAPDTVGPGHWTMRGSELSIPGRWEVTVTALYADLTQESTTFDIDVTG